LSWTAKYRGGVHKERGMRGEKRQELGRHCAERSVQRPGSSWTPEANGASTQEIRIMSHERGNPDTEVGRTLNEDERTFRRRRDR